MPVNWPPERHEDDFTHREDFSGEFRDHYHRKPNSEDIEPAPGTKPVKSIETEPTPETKLEKQPKFNWVAFIVMIILIGVALLVGILIPGILDEYIAMFIITTLYGFAQAHGFKTPKK
ncbi:MAG: hypothetical protein UW41_C0038G0001 [Candidatus Collierbacteria bacterium GW2011_GWC2_44_18]|uniref:Uncharacterized protein n=2 Tax=Microgenomates group TaxID=1794810 RepID=A0A0G1J223_9BACT|nr:MAG: hypothetical protein UW16_C0028G0010 [Microgenomates group bacterium GW2011_GWC1_44_10]KKT48161.1 MAG: hypothetical protein UW41_C0038G0001 [Candidatus Collierbacteria bacterium GW2011_GWC2_44_18]KKT65621.1 MAG: hypothetical protein UW60_C0040G0010 [Candidatus Woesebacteria bacterium GW2011_GWA2_44_33]